MLRRLEFHFVPKHASWLNMVEIEIGVLRNQCLDGPKARINWMFTTDKAGAKMGHAYPKPSTKES